MLNRFSGWLDYPEYYFFWNLHGNNSIFNISAYKNPAMDKLIDRARFTEDKAEYDKTVTDFIALCMQEVPIIPLNQPIHDVAMQKAVGGYQFWFHREPDFRQFTKSNDPGRVRRISAGATRRCSVWRSSPIAALDLSNPAPRVARRHGPERLTTEDASMSDFDRNVAAFPGAAPDAGRGRCGPARPHDPRLQLHGRRRRR